MKKIGKKKKTGKKKRFIFAPKIKRWYLKHRLDGPSSLDIMDRYHLHGKVSRQRPPACEHLSKFMI